MKYRQITEDERYTISRMKTAGYTKTEIAKVIGKHKSSISRELKRNMSPDGGYRPDHAAGHARVMLSRSRKKPQYDKALFENVVTQLENEWAPEQISLTFRKYNLSNISYSTIYRFIKNDKKNSGELYTHLRQYRKWRRKRNGKPDSRGVLRCKRPLEDRPSAATERSERGHFEIDLMHGKPDTHCILTLVDRMTLYTVIIKLRNKSKDEVFRALVPYVFKLKIKSITADNGTEWHGFHDIEKATNVKFYFAKPYHSWERGTNENTNGLIRQYIPKGFSMKGITQDYCNFISNRLNQRPRKILDMNCPDFCYLGKPLLLHFK
jgi:transposase, IS30 family